MAGLLEKSEFDEEREKQEEAAAKSKKVDQDDKEQNLTISRGKIRKKWEEKRKSQEAIELDNIGKTSTSKFDPFGGKPRHKTTSFMNREGYERIIDDKEEKN